MFFAIGCVVDRSGFDPIDDCFPVTCEQLGQRCGIIDDGCGRSVDCGPCEDCVPDTCDTLGAQCGAIGDGCAMSLDCGGCSEPDTCLGNLCICQRLRCEDLGAECGQINDGCGNVVTCGRCGRQETCNDDLLCECVPKDCDELDAECGSVDDGCGNTIHCGGCGSGEVCLPGNECACEEATCESVGSPECGLFWNECAEEIFGCGLSCDVADTCVAEECARLGPNNLVINEFSTRDEFIEILGPPNFDLQSHFIIGIEGDQDENPGLIRIVLALGAPVAQPRVTLDAYGYRTYTLPVQGIKSGTMTLLLVRDFSPGGIGPVDIDSEDDGALDLPLPFQFLLDEVAVRDGGTDDYTYSGSSVLLRDFDDRDRRVRGASRIPNGVDTESPSDWIRNAENGFGIVADAPVPEPGLAINTPNGRTVYDVPGYNIVIDEP